MRKLLEGVRKLGIQLNEVQMRYAIILFTQSIKLFQLEFDSPPSPHLHYCYSPPWAMVTWYR
jgi:hypothetical protein